MKCRGNRNIQLNPLDKPEPIEGLGGRVVDPTTPTRPLPRPTSPRGGDSNAVIVKVCTGR